MSGRLLKKKPVFWRKSVYIYEGYGRMFQAIFKLCAIIFLYSDRLEQTIGGANENIDCRR